MSPLVIVTGVSRREGPGFETARQLKEPGYHVITEQWGARPVGDSAKGIVWAATLPDNGPAEGFSRDAQILSW